MSQKEIKESLELLEKEVGLDIAIDSKQNIYVLEPMAQVIHIFKEN